MSLLARAPVAIAAACAVCAGCQRAPLKQAVPAPDAAAALVPAAPDPDALTEAQGLPLARRAIQVVHGVEREVDADEARARGLTVVDLSDGWAPHLFQDGVATDGAPLPNRYRSVFVGLADDRSDGDGQALPPGVRNYLELYGIPPTLSVLRGRFLADAGRTCDRQIDAAKLLAVDLVQTWGSSTERKELARGEARAVRLEQARVDAGAATLEELAVQQPRHGKEVLAHRRFEAERAAFAEIERRLVCEGLLDPARHQVGSYDTAMRLAMLDFQQKHVLNAQADITRGTLEALARPLLDNDLEALTRVLTERAAHAGNLLEDGSVTPPAVAGKPRRLPTYLAEDGQRVPVPDLVGAATKALLARLGIATAGDAGAFFRRHGDRDFEWLKVAVRFPARPPYYGPQMDLFAEIDRGDIWYEFPFDSSGQRLPQPRGKFPAFTLFVRWKGERVPLMKWRTTIGGWRAELAADGQEYYRYKGSDVGPRVWRHVVAAPVWIPPLSSPLGGMAKTKWVNGTPQEVVNYDETGPGYLSAYGLAAAIHVQPVRRDGQLVGWFDNGIRTHGSSDYLSLRGRFSHGCHRLHNNLAVRLFSFVLAHRRAKVLGQVALDARRTFYRQGGVFEMRLPTRGFYYELDPPLPVETLEGEVKGEQKKAFAGYQRKPGVEYANAVAPPVSGSPEDRAGGGAPDPASLAPPTEPPP